MFTHFFHVPPPPPPQSNVGKTTIDLIQIRNNYQHCVWGEGKFCSKSFKMSICLQIFFHDCRSHDIARPESMFTMQPRTQGCL